MARILENAHNPGNRRENALERFFTEQVGVHRCKYCRSRFEAERDDFQHIDVRLKKHSTRVTSYVRCPACDRVVLINVKYGFDPKYNVAPIHRFIEFFE